MNPGAASDMGKVSGIIKQADHVEIYFEFRNDTTLIKPIMNLFARSSVRESDHDDHELSEISRNLRSLILNKLDWTLKEPIPWKA